MIKIKFSYHVAEELSYFLCCLQKEYKIVSCKTSANQKGSYKKAYITLLTEQRLLDMITESK